MSLKGGEIDHKDAGVTICKRIGVVQAADSRERIAKGKCFECVSASCRMFHGSLMLPSPVFQHQGSEGGVTDLNLNPVRWFSAPTAAFQRCDPYQSIYPTRYGSMSEETSEVSLYEVMAHPALGRWRGDLLIIVPDLLPPIDSLGVSQPSPFQQLIEQAYQIQETSDSYACQNPAQARSPSVQTAEMSSSKIPERTSNDIDWFGEVVDLGLDGNMTVRLGAADEVRDVNIPYERVVLVARSDDESVFSDEQIEDEASDKDEGVASDDEMEDEASNEDESVASDEEMEDEDSNDDESVASDEEMDDEASDDAWETDDSVENDSAGVNVAETLPSMPRQFIDAHRTEEPMTQEDLDEICLNPVWWPLPRYVIRLPSLWYSYSARHTL